MDRKPFDRDDLDHRRRSQGLTRRGFAVSFGAGLGILAMPTTSRAALGKVPTSTGIDAVFAPFVVASERKMFEKYGLETSYKPFDDGNVALDAVLTGQLGYRLDERAGRARALGQGRQAVRHVVLVDQQGADRRYGSGDIKKPRGSDRQTVGYPRASAGHLLLHQLRARNTSCRWTRSK